MSKEFLARHVFPTIFETIFEDSVSHGNGSFMTSKMEFQQFTNNFNTLVFISSLQFWSKILCKTEPMKDFIFLFFLYVIYLCALFYCCFRFALMMQLEFRMHLYSNLRKCKKLATGILIKVHSFIPDVYSLAVRLKIEACKTDGLKVLLLAKLFLTLNKLKK
ncbi:unnamed protein product [Brugia pahangi]|uniref:Uncharacterized protein n=1 Tax=Brugia pahangi TaxID=6280 RepID=A0A0N4T5R4_BRUPA|nr:unnamed protein product [Brugia pahangi]